MGIEVDICPECRGVWFDAGEMPDYLQKLLDADANIPNMGIDLDEKAKAINEVRERSRACPRCDVHMRKHNYAYDSNVILDACEECGGHWADGGEVRRLAIYTKGNPKLDRLADSMAAHVEDHQKFQQLARDVAGFGAPPSGWFYLLSPVRIILPLYDELPSAITPWVTMLFMVINILVMGLVAFADEPAAEYILSLALVPSAVADGDGGYYRLVSYMFLHAGLFHLLGNVLFLWIFGDNIEEEFGHASFFGFYILSGVMAASAHMMFTASPELPLVGASGAVAGVMGAYFVFHPNAVIKTWIIAEIWDIPAVFYLVVWFALQVVPAWMEWGGIVESNVAYAAHAAGFGTGVSLAFARKLVVGIQPAKTTD